MFKRITVLTTDDIYPHITGNITYLSKQQMFLAKNNYAVKTLMFITTHLITAGEITLVMDGKTFKFSVGHKRTVDKNGYFT